MIIITFRQYRRSIISTVPKKRENSFVYFNENSVYLLYYLSSRLPRVSQTRPKRFILFSSLSSFLLPAAFSLSYLYRILFFTFTLPLSLSMTEIERNLFAILPSLRSARQEFNFLTLSVPVQWIFCAKLLYVCRVRSCRVEDQKRGITA